MTDDVRKAYYELWEKFRLENGSVFPSTWFELNWVKEWNFDLEKTFFEGHNLNTYRRRFLASTAKYSDVAKSEGDFIEFGSYFGFGSYLMLKNSKRHLHIVDSFQGLSQPAEIDGSFWSAHDMKVEREFVEHNLREFIGRFTIHEGWIPDILSSVQNSNFLFAHVDLDLFEPTLASLNWLSSKMAHNSLILCDDYGFSTCPGATAACEQFQIESAQWRLLPLPVGGCLFMQA